MRPPPARTKSEKRAYRPPLEIGGMLGAKMGAAQLRLLCTGPCQGLNVRPEPEKIVIAARQGNQGLVPRRVAAQLLQRCVHLEQDFALGILAHHALDPKKSRQPDTARHW